MDLIERQKAIDAIHCDITVTGKQNAELVASTIGAFVDRIKALPPAQPVASDKISQFIDGLEEMFADIRERHVDNSVCGLCEYDGAYVGQSGDWCNECPGFEKDDCFKLSDKTRKEWTEEIIKALPSVQLATDTNVGDMISRQAAIDAYGGWYVDECTEGGFIGTVKQLLEGLPPVQPERKKGHWIAPKYYPTQFTYTCSKCGYKQSFNGKFKFCPNCGADMRGERNG